MPISQNMHAIWNQSFPTQDEAISLQAIATSVQYIVIYCYPKDNTPGCTNESKDFQASIAKFKELNTAVLGVSRDSVASHQKFATKLGLAFPLIADKDEVICRALGVIKEKNMFGKLGFGIERSTFLLNSTGEILQEWRKVKVDGHIEAVLASIKTHSQHK